MSHLEILLMKEDLQVDRACIERIREKEENKLATVLIHPLHITKTLCGAESHVL